MTQNTIQTLDTFKPYYCGYSQHRVDALNEHGICAECEQQYRTFQADLNAQMALEESQASSIRYITVDDTHRLEVLNGKHYPQYQCSDGHYAYYRTGNKERSFKTEIGARKFLAGQEK